jgi:hypothetical protein
MRIPLFFAKKGHWGEHGMVKVSFWKWLSLMNDYVTKVRWVRCKWGNQKR